MKRPIITPNQALIALDNQIAREFPQDQGGGAPAKAGVICLANETRFNEANFSQPLTTFATGLPVGDVQADVDFLAPRIMVPRRFEYDNFDNIHELQGNPTDDLRAIGQEFKRVEYRSAKVDGHTDNRGLAMVIDLDNVAPGANWEQDAVRKLKRRLMLNKLRRLYTAYAAGTAAAETWNGTAGSDPDQDVLTDLVASLTTGGVRANRVYYGATAWNKRVLTHRAQNLAGGYASAAMTPQELAGFLMAGVFVSQAVYQSTISAKAEVMGSNVFVFLSQDSPDTEDPRNVAHFVSPATGGGDYGVFSMQIGTKQWLVAVEHYEKIVTVKSGGMYYKAIT